MGCEIINDAPEITPRNNDNSVTENPLKRIIHSPHNQTKDLIPLLKTNTLADSITTNTHK